MYLKKAPRSRTPHWWPSQCHWRGGPVIRWFSLWMDVSENWERTWHPHATYQSSQPVFPPNDTNSGSRPLPQSLEETGLLHLPKPKSRESHLFIYRGTGGVGRLGQNNQLIQSTWNCLAHVSLAKFETLFDFPMTFVRKKKLQNESRRFFGFWKPPVCFFHFSSGKMLISLNSGGPKILKSPTSGQVPPILSGGGRGWSLRKKKMSESEANEETQRPQLFNQHTKKK